MSRKCVRWSKEALEARGWRDPNGVTYRNKWQAVDPCSPKPVQDAPPAAQKPARATKAAKNTAIAKEADRIASQPPAPPYWRRRHKAVKPPPDPIQPRQRTHKAAKAIPYERDVLRAVLAALQAHPRVAWAVRLNSGMAMLPGRGGRPQPVRFGFEGAPDIIGQMGEAGWDNFQMKNGLLTGITAWGQGAFLAVEVKRPGKKATMAQAAFLLRVREAGGVGFVADSVERVWEHLGKP